MSLRCIFVFLGLSYGMGLYIGYGLGERKIKTEANVKIAQALKLERL